jgi:hypothetical protein
MVLSGPGSLNAERRRDTPWLDHSPGSTRGGAFHGVVLNVVVSRRHSAISLSHDVLRLALVEFAIGLRRSEDGNISPRSGVPVGIVISFLGAFVTVSVSVVVLTSEDGSTFSTVKIALLFSVGNEETHVTFSVLAILVILVGFVHTVFQLSVSIELRRRSGVIVDGVGGGTISNENHRIIVGVGAHVLNNHVTIHSGVSTATVLNGPFNSQLRSLIVRHSGTNTISSLSIVLGVEQSVSIVSVGVGFVQSVVGASGILHVAVP